MCVEMDKIVIRTIPLEIMRQNGSFWYCSPILHYKIVHKCSVDLKKGIKPVYIYENIFRIQYYLWLKVSTEDLKPG